MLVWDDLLGHHDKVDMAIKRLKSFEPEDGYFVAFSGGKDSQCIYHLCEMAGVKFDAHYSVTSVDPPPLVRFIKKQYPQVSIDIPHDRNGKPISMWSLIVQHTIPPTRMARYCCAELKECNGVGRVTVTGVRWAESVRRKNLHGTVDISTQSKKIIGNAIENVGGAAVNDRGGLILNDDNDEARRMVEQCFRTHKTLVNPIVDWTDEDVWEFLNDVAKVPHCELYDPPYNYTRIGCIGCPMTSKAQMERDFENFPKYKDMYIRAFDRMIEAHKNTDNPVRLANREVAEVGGVDRCSWDGQIGLETGLPTDFDGDYREMDGGAASSERGASGERDGGNSSSTKCPVGIGRSGRNARLPDWWTGEKQFEWYIGAIKEVPYES